MKTSNQNVVEMQVFNHTQLGKVRGCIEGDNAWLMGNDVAKALGYKNPRKALADHVDSEDQTRNESLRVKGRQVVMINESGLYSLLLRSNLPAAREFKRWITNEVLPQIRHTGAYLPPHVKHLQDNVQRLMNNNHALAVEVSRLKLDNEQLSHKAGYVDEVLLSIDCLTTTQVAKEMNLCAHQLYTLLKVAGVIYRQSGQYLLAAPFAHLNLAKNRTLTFQDEHGHTRTTTYLVWTQLGRAFLHQLLKECIAA